MPDESARRRESARVLRTALRRLRWERLKFRLRLIGPLRYYEFFESLGTVEARSDESYLLVMASHPGNGRPPLLLTPGYHCRFGQFVRGTGEVRYAEITLTVDDAGRPRLRSVGRTHPGDRAGWRAMVRDIRALWSTRGSGVAHEEDTFEAAVRRYHARWPSPRRGSGASARSGFSEPGEGNAHGGSADGTARTPRASALGTAPPPSSAPLGAEAFTAAAVWGSERPADRDWHVRAVVRDGAGQTSVARAWGGARRKPDLVWFQDRGAPRPIAVRSVRRVLEWASPWAAEPDLVPNLSGPAGGRPVSRPSDPSPEEGPLTGRAAPAPASGPASDAPPSPSSAVRRVRVRLRYRDADTALIYVDGVELGTLWRGGGYGWELLVEGFEPDLFVPLESAFDRTDLGQALPELLAEHFGEPVTVFSVITEQAHRP
ncbi:hypothetical protein A9R04_07285 [Nocardiopsis dassonvillei]|uniref:hypothetical protein n=1 Tax=Nocardiopsis dassonvillei TaxID=2014 RepID=UPI0008FC8E22|nr:hypothetical protein [Nocardiopsis dassonvillei]APC34503.1 hypothetical protein A9R04_07285 [Nocardiopsis dassonvillei]